MSVWKHLPKSSGLGKLSKKHKKAFKKSEAYRKSHRVTIKVKKSKVAPVKKVKATVPKPKPATWHFWGSRQSLSDKDKVVASLKRQGYKVRVDGVGDYYKIYTMGRASKYS